MNQSFAAARPLRGPALLQKPRERSAGTSSFCPHWFTITHPESQWESTRERRSSNQRAGKNQPWRACKADQPRRELSWAAREAGAKRHPNLDSPYIPVTRYLWIRVIFFLHFLSFIIMHRRVCHSMTVSIIKNSFKFYGLLIFRYNKVARLSQFCSLSLAQVKCCLSCGTVGNSYAHYIQIDHGDAGLNLACVC